MEKGSNISFRGVENTPEVQDLVDERIDRLERYCDHITGVDVAVEKRQSSIRAGSDWRVRVDITVPPGHEVVSTYEENKSAAPVPLHLAVTRAFEGAEKQLQKLSQKQRGEVKQHPQQEPQGVITKLFTAEGYGFFLSDDGREIYFRDSAVLNGRFEDLELGAAVHFTAAQGEDGPQASTVRLIHKRGRSSPMETGT